MVPYSWSDATNEAAKAICGLLGRTERFLQSQLTGRDSTMTDYLEQRMLELRESLAPTLKRMELEPVVEVTPENKIYIRFFTQDWTKRSAVSLWVLPPKSEDAVAQWNMMDLVIEDIDTESFTVGTEGCRFEGPDGGEGYVQTLEAVRTTRGAVTRVRGALLTNPMWQCVPGPGVTNNSDMVLMSDELIGYYNNFENLVLAVERDVSGVEALVWEDEFGQKLRIAYEGEDEDSGVAVLYVEGEEAGRLSWNDYREMIGLIADQYEYGPEIETPRAS